jgi:hypothetical protein
MTITIRDRLAKDQRGNIAGHGDVAAGSFKSINDLSQVSMGEGIKAYL